jgi:UDP-N-acetylmuramoyl-tripeptide--D-alanyl-D-alanine ligase
VKPRPLRDVALAVGGSLRGPGDAEVRGAAVDSRAVRSGDVFFALTGEHVDGHRYVGDALARGASGAVVRRGWSEGDDRPLIDVDRPESALLDLAAAARADLDAIVVGITGSTGKTCTKDFTAGVLVRRFDVVASRASFNNEVGLPLTVLEAAPHTEALVCEMGSRGPGHIRLLCRVARPTMGVVTNVGVAHMELFGSPEVLRDAKAELPEALPEEGVAVLNGDDPVVRTFADRTPAKRVVLFGATPDAHVRSGSVDLDRATGLATFELITPDGSAEVTLPAPGDQLVPDALAAAAVGWAASLPVDDIAAGLASASVSAGRMELTTVGGLRIVNDAYNANPTSVSAALKTARAMAGEGRCIAVLGYMAELGPIAAREHERVGELVARLGIDVVVVVGQEARLIGVAAKREGVEPDRVLQVADPGDAAEAVRRVARPGDLVLVKASRVERLERVVEALSRSGIEEGTDASSPASSHGRRASR